MFPLTRKERQRNSEVVKIGCRERCPFEMRQITTTTTTTIIIIKRRYMYWTIAHFLALKEREEGKKVKIRP